MLLNNIAFKRALVPTAAIVTLLVSGCASQRPPATQTTSTPAPPKMAPAVTTAPAPAPVRIKPTAPTRYVVKKGDTLWGIAQRFLYDPWDWPEVWYANPQIKNPHWIYPGDVLTLYYVNGKPRISVTGGPRVIVLKPTITYKKLPATEHPIPIQTIRPFLIHPRVVPAEEMIKAPHIVGSSSGELMYGNGAHVYVRGLPAKPAVLYSLYRPGKALKSPKTGRVIAHQATYVGTIRIIRDQGPIATGVIQSVTEEVLPGDRLLPYDKLPSDYTFMPQAPKVAIHGQVISLFNAISMVGQYQVVVLDLGSKQGVRRGDVVALEQHGGEILDKYASPGESRYVRLPNSRSGLAMIFRTFKNISYALVMSATRPIVVGDVVTNPSASTG